MQKNKQQIYCDEIDLAFETIKQYMPLYPEIPYFLQCIREYFEKVFSECDHSKIWIVGTGIPEEIVYSCGSKPHFLLAGSQKMASFAEYAVPRDADPVSKSSLGFLLEENEDSLIMLPLVNDDSRKLAFILKTMGKRVFTMDIPPMKDDGGEQEYSRQIQRAMHQLGSYSKKAITKKVLQKNYNMISQVKEEIRIFDRLSDNKTDSINGICRMLILYSYYCSNDIGEWNVHLAKLNNRLSREPDIVCQQYRPRVILAGSPIYFPNYKIPLLAQEAGFHIVGCADSSNIRLLTENLARNQEKKSLESLLTKEYQKDCSSAYPDNEAYRNALKKLILQKKVDGVIYHVLKGQIEYDFELNRLENIFSELEIPFIRLETDYSPQDVEQLRIRVEAFAEILFQNQRRYLHGREKK